jgi:hypothetical protein
MSRSRFRRSWQIGVAIAASILLTLLAQQAIAALAGPGQRETVASPATTQRANLNATRVVTVTEPAVRTTSSTTFTTLTSTTMFVPGGQRALFVARFSGESNCTGGNQSNWCSLRILVDGSEMRPVVGDNFAFDSVGESAGEACTSGVCGWESHSIDRTSVVLGAGTHGVRVEWKVVTFGGTPEFWIDDWQLTVEQWRVS